MITRLVDAGWSQEIVEGVRSDASVLRIISPFIKVDALQRLLAAKPRALNVITRFNLVDFSEGVSDTAALRKILSVGGSVRGVKNLHAKMYLFGSKRAIVTSANLTSAALDRNHEFGLISEDSYVIDACRAYFDNLWNGGRADLTTSQINQWDATIVGHRVAGGRPNLFAGLEDFGADVGVATSNSTILPTVVADARQAFVKFLGESRNRAPLSLSVLDEVKGSGCHWALAYPATKRPRAVNDGAVMFIGRLTRDPYDIRVFGRAIGMRHLPGRDDATAEDIESREWKATWPRYVRVHHAKFVAGNLANGISLNELMTNLGSDCFVSTKRNTINGKGNVDPRQAFRQQAAVQLTAEGAAWLDGRLEAAFDQHGTVPRSELDHLDWPQVP